MVYGCDLVYGDAPVYGDDCVTPTPPVPDDCDGCGRQAWRVEATHLHTGVVKAVLRPLSMDFQETYSTPGDGSLLVDTLEPSAYDTWPHTTGVYISQVFTDGTRVGRFGGFVERVAAAGGGATSLVLRSMDQYPFHRLLVNPNEGIGYSTPGYVDPDNPGPGLSQTKIAEDLTRIAIDGTGFIPLTPVAEASTQTRVRSWVASDFKNLGDALTELTSTIDGVRYRLTHTFYEDPARWVSTIRFTDETNTDRGVKIRSDSEAFRYGITVDAKNQASRVFGVGAGSGTTQMFSVAYDEDADLPEFQATVAFKDIEVPATLDEQTRGEVTKRRDPATTPTATLVGLTDVPPEDLKSGDIITADIGYGVFTFRDEQARVVSQSWRVAPEQPVTRELALDPVIRPSLSVKTQTPAVALPPETTTTPLPQTPITPPAPAAGLVTTVRVGSLTEISGMQYADGNVFLHNDENNNPQVVLVSLSTGQQVGSYNTAGPNRKDPEAIRAHPDGRIILGDIGDNDNKRSSVKLYVVNTAGNGAVYTIKYPFGPTNAEALLIHPVSGELFVATKNGKAVTFGTGPTYGGTGTQVASGLVSGISDGTFTTDGRYVLFTVAGASVVYVYAYPGWSAVGTIAVPGLPKCEAITVESACSFLITTEGKNAPIHRVLIPKAFGGCA